MNVRLHSLVLATAALLAPSLAFGLGTIEGFYGIARPPSTSFRAATGGVQDDPRPFKDSEQNAGGDVMLNWDWLQVGAIADHTWASNKASVTALGGLLGVKIGLGVARLDLMGEAGGHRFGNLGSETNGNKEQWLAYVGLRPGLAFRFSPPDTPGLILGVWAFARWDLTTNRVPVTAANAGNTTPSSLKLGGTQIGATVRLGFEF
jgi:hypothetical protein